MEQNSKQEEPKVSSSTPNKADFAHPPVKKVGNEGCPVAHGDGSFDLEAYTKARMASPSLEEGPKKDLLPKGHDTESTTVGHDFLC